MVEQLSWDQSENRGKDHFKLPIFERHWIYSSAIYKDSMNLVSFPMTWCGLVSFPMT
jgi:hypothetical protein